MGDRESVAGSYLERAARGQLQCSYAFGGAFYAWPFHCGVAAYVQENRPLHAEAKVFGTSSGSLAASLLVCGVNIREHGLHAANRSTDAHVGRVGPYLRPRTIAESLRLFIDTLPPDAHERASGRLVLTLTQVPRMTVRPVSWFANRRALVEALYGTMAVPGHSVHFAFKTRALRLGWVLDGGLRPLELRDPRPMWQTVRVASFRQGDAPRSYATADIHPRKRVGLRTRFLKGPVSHRLSWFEHGYECAREYFEPHSAPVSASGEQAAERWHQQPSKVTGNRSLRQRVSRIVP